MPVCAPHFSFEGPRLSVRFSFFFFSKTRHNRNPEESSRGFRSYFLKNTPQPKPRLPPNFNSRGQPQGRIRGWIRLTKKSRTSARRTLRHTHPWKAFVLGLQSRKASRMSYPARISGLLADATFCSSPAIPSLPSKLNTTRLCYSLVSCLGIVFVREQPNRNELPTLRQADGNTTSSCRPQPAFTICLQFERRQQVEVVRIPPCFFYGTHTDTQARPHAQTRIPRTKIRYRYLRETKTTTSTAVTVVPSACGRIACQKTPETGWYQVRKRRFIYSQQMHCRVFYRRPDSTGGACTAVTSRAEPEWRAMCLLHRNTHRRHIFINSTEMSLSGNNSATAYIVRGETKLHWDANLRDKSATEYSKNKCNRGRKLEDAAEHEPATSVVQLRAKNSNPLSVCQLTKPTRNAPVRSTENQRL